jgi:general secretion pathway protein E
VDGVLRDYMQVPKWLHNAVVSRLKILAKLDIAERRLPQDGRIQLRAQGKLIDLRVSTVPTLYGESLVLRILDKEELNLDFDTLGFAVDTKKSLQKTLTLPHGIILVTGPTGSGKTTTLYAALQQLNTPDRKILTVEDPVEYQLEGINQIQVKPQIGLNFADALRSIVRQDPDVIMIGEMRDLETARIAVQSALTGHLVFSTLHTNDAGSSITRLLDMGVEDYLLTSTLNGILAQRLVRKLCLACRATYRPVPELIDELQLARFADAGELTLYRAVGCDACAGTGYRGRSVIAELLILSEPIRRLILARADGTEIQRTAIANGMANMKQDGLKKAVLGITTIEEVTRVTQE